MQKRKVKKDEIFIEWLDLTEIIEILNLKILL